MKYWFLVTSVKKIKLLDLESGGYMLVYNAQSYWPTVMCQTNVGDIYVKHKPILGPNSLLLLKINAPTYTLTGNPVNIESFIEFEERMVFLPLHPWYFYLYTHGIFTFTRMVFLPLHAWYFYLYTHGIFTFTRMVFLPLHAWYFYLYTHGIFTFTRMVFLPLHAWYFLPLHPWYFYLYTHGIFTFTRMVFLPLHPWYFYLYIYGIFTFTHMVFLPLPSRYVAISSHLLNCYVRAFYCDTGKVKWTFSGTKDSSGPAQCGIVYFPRHGDP